MHQLPTRNAVFMCSKHRLIKGGKADTQWEVAGFLQGAALPVGTGHVQWCARLCVSLSVG